MLTGVLSVIMKYGWWSENCLIVIPAVDSSSNILIMQNKCVDQSAI